MDGRLRFDVAAADADGETAAPAAGIRPGRRLTAILLVAAAALDLTRCSLVVMTARHPAPAAGLVAAGLAAAALSVRTARGCQAGRRWSGWTALLIGAASAPQAAASGFHAPYAIPDTATAALGVVLAVAVLATAGPAAQPGHDSDDLASLTESHPLTSTAAAVVQAHDPRDAARAPWSAADGPPPRAHRDSASAATPMRQRNTRGLRSANQHRETADRETQCSTPPGADPPSQEGFPSGAGRIGTGTAARLGSARQPGITPAGGT